MTLFEYKETHFLKDLSLLKYSKPKHFLLDLLASLEIDENTRFFGGSNWNNFEEDIENVDECNYNNFFLCLFTMSIIDRTIFTYFRDIYPEFKKRTEYPKFGWCGLGHHFEDSKMLVDIPFQKGFLNIEEIDVDAYTSYFFHEVTSIGEYISPNEINLPSFFNFLNSDPDFQNNEQEMNKASSFLITHLKQKI